MVVFLSCCDIRHPSENGGKSIMQMQGRAKVN